MPKAPSIDLRERIAALVEEGRSRRALARCDLGSDDAARYQTSPANGSDLSPAISMTRSSQNLAPYERIEYFCISIGARRRCFDAYFIALGTSEDRYLSFEALRVLTFAQPTISELNVAGFQAG